MNQETYISNQFWKVLPTDVVVESLRDDFQIRMKIQSQLGQTNYINLTIEQFREIECLLATWQEQIYVEKREYNPDNYRGI
jgi:hypothetical protein